MYPIDNLKIILPSVNIEPQVPADISIQHSTKTDEQPVAIEGQFIIAEGNSDHLFRPYDFIKEDAIQLSEGDAIDKKNDDKAFILNPSLARIEIIEGQFICSRIF